jgi:UDP-N-acetylglucosamine 2-epimerase (non-hydrolysing)
MMALSMHLLHIVGARPNFMKLAPVYRALQARSVQQTIIHTGQHYDENMAGVFFQQLGIPHPDQDLAVGSASHAQQTAAIMSRLEPVLTQCAPDVVVVYGDVNSTVAAALVCAKLQIPLAHVEAGLRSFDRTMPEEINRLVTDQLADLLFTPSEDGNQNLLREGVAPEKIVFVGNVMIDTLVRLLPLAIETVPEDLPKTYALLTLHRPSNVDDPRFLRPILETLSGFAGRMAILFPVHPRTRKKLSEFQLDRYCAAGFRLMEPLPYLEFLGLQRRATCVITDSGGIQEEATFLEVPCMTVRENTERPVTITCGTNILVGRNMTLLANELRRVLNGQAKSGTRPDLWDGQAAERIADSLLARFGLESEINATDTATVSN